jgi:hypothetical protein
MKQDKKLSPLESEEAKKAKAKSEAEEADKDASELDEEEAEADSETQENEGKKDSADESEEEAEESEESDEDSDEEAEESEEEEADEKKDEEKEEEKDEEDAEKKAKEGDACTMPDGSKGKMKMQNGKMNCVMDKAKKTDSSEESKEKSALSEEAKAEVSSLVDAGVQKGLKEFFSNLFKKEAEAEESAEGAEGTEAEKSEKKDKTATAELEISGEGLAVLKTILERQDKIEKMLSKKTAVRKTIKSVAVNKDEEEASGSEETFKTVDEELASVKKQFSNDPEKAFIECGKVRRKWAEKE